jgi:very-short-patch-repair endonuclease
VATPLDPANLDHAIQLYLGGQPMQEILTTASISNTAFHRERTRRGIPPRSHLALDDSAIVLAYLAGESEYSLSQRLGVSRDVIRKRLLAGDVRIRDRSVAGKNRASRMTPEERLSQVSAAHNSMRGVKVPLERLIKQALGREKAGRFHSAGEQAMFDLLTQRGLAPIPQKAIGKYNADLAVAPVAVEILGGGWHLEKRHHAVRTPEILDAGWHLVFVWNHEGRSALSPKAADYVVTFLDEVRRNPSSVGQYRVISGDGELLAARSRDDDQFPLVRAPRGRVSSRTRNSHSGG